jgi:UDP-N-acetylmuramoylalanine--D-glutamate ligase
MELSSFQLMDAQNAPDVAVLTNLSENHLDYHRDMDEYVAAKARIFAHRRCRIAVLNAADARTPALLATLRPELEVRLFGWGQDARLCVACHGGQIFVRGVPYLRCDELPIPGRHNVENVMAALAACYEHLSVTQARAAILSFSGVAHRLQRIAIKNGVHYYESSIDSTPTRTLASLQAMTHWHGRLHLLLGGYDKHLDYTPLAAPVAASAKAVYLFGATAQKIGAVLAAHPACPPLYYAKDLGDAIRHAAACAVTDDAVLLSPACASFDTFVNFEARGNYFSSIVSQL